MPIMRSPHISIRCMGKCSRPPVAGRVLRVYCYSPEAEMRVSHRLVACLAAAFLAPWVGHSQPATLYEGARLILGDASAPIENGAFLVQNGRITAIGPKGSVTAPRDASRVDLTGKTVIPALNNIHLHIGYE